MSEDESEYSSGVFERMIGLNKYMARALDFFMVHKEFEYPENELSEYANIPQPDMYKIVSVFKKLRILNVEGDEPNRIISVNTSEEIVQRLDKAFIELAILDLYRMSIEDGYEDKDNLK